MGNIKFLILSLNDRFFGALFKDEVIQLGTTTLSKTTLNIMAFCLTIKYDTQHKQPYL